MVGSSSQSVSALTRTVGNTRTAADLSRDMALRGALGQGIVPVVPALRSVLPAGGLERGRIYGCTGDAQVSLLFAAASLATREGSWFAMVDMEHAGLQSAREHDVALQRVLCVSAGGVRAWPLVVGALVDGVDIVAVASPSCRASDARRIAARVRASGAILFVLGRPGEIGVDIRLDSRTVSWHFDLHAQVRRVDVSVSGRRVHGGRCDLMHLPMMCAPIDPVDPVKS